MDNLQERRDIFLRLISTLAPRIFGKDVGSFEPSDWPKIKALLDNLQEPPNKAP